MKELVQLDWLFIFQLVHRSTHWPTWVNQEFSTNVHILFFQLYQNMLFSYSFFPQLAAFKISVRCNPLSPDGIILETPIFGYTEVISILLSMRVISFHSLGLYPEQKIRNFLRCFPEELLTRPMEMTVWVIVSDDNCHKSNGNTLIYTTYFRVILKGSQSCLMIS